MKSPIFRTYEVFTIISEILWTRKIENAVTSPFTGRTLWTRENAEWLHVDTDSGTVIRDVYLGTDRLTEGVLGIRRTAPKVSVHMPAKGTLGIRSVAPEFRTCDATKQLFRTRRNRSSSRKRPLHLWARTQCTTECPRVCLIRSPEASGMVRMYRPVCTIRYCVP